MPDSKVLEIRDAATYIAVIATRTTSEVDQERYHFGRAGYPDDFVIVTRIGSLESQYNPFDWGMTRTMQVAHKYIREEWENIKNLDVIDVEHIMGRRSTVKETEYKYRL